MMFARNKVEGEWLWGEHKFPMVCSYSYLGVDFACNGAWDIHVNKVIDSGRKSNCMVSSVVEVLI